MASLGSGRWNTVHCSFITVLLISACLVSEKCCESPSSQLIAGLNDGTIPDLETSETGVIDTNLVDVNNVGERGYFPCKDLGSPVLNMNRCCSFKVGPLDVTNVQKCCLGQGSNCNYDPGYCCNYLQMTCLPDPVLSGIYTCQKVDGYRARVNTSSYGYSNPLPQHSNSRLSYTPEQSNSRLSYTPEGRYLGNAVGNYGTTHSRIGYGLQLYQPRSDADPSGYGQNSGQSYTNGTNSIGMNSPLIPSPGNGGQNDDGNEIGSENSSGNDASDDGSKRRSLQGSWSLQRPKPAVLYLRFDQLLNDKSKQRSGKDKNSNTSG